MFEKFQQVIDRINRVRKMLENSQEVMDKINRTLEVQGKLQQVIGKAEPEPAPGFSRQVGPGHNQPIVPL